MTSAFLYLLNFILIAIETSMVFLLASGFFSKRSSISFACLSLAILIILANLNVFLLEEYPLFKITVNVLLHTIWVVLNYRASIVKCFVSIILLTSFQIITDNAFLIISSLLTSNLSNQILSNPYAYYILCYSAKLFELFLLVFVRTWAKKRFHQQSSPWTDWLRVLFFPFSAVLISIFLLSILNSEPHLASQLLGCTVVLLATVFMSILLLDHLERQQTAILDNIVLKQNLKLETDHIQSLQEAYSAQRKQTHDFENQLAVLQSMAKRSASQEEFNAYLEKILAISFPSVSYVNTHRMVVDIIFSQKYALAKSKGIVFNQKLDDLSTFPLPDDALVVVLTNLIDNAIEACEKVPSDEERSILLKMQVTPDVSYLYVENTTAFPVQIRNNQIATTKEQPLAHGYGLKNIYAMLDYHNALYVLDYDDTSHTFRFSAKIPSHA